MALLLHMGILKVDMQPESNLTWLLGRKHHNIPFQTEGWAPWDGG